MSVKINQVAGPSGTLHFYYYWLPPLLLTAGILIVAGDLGSTAKFQLPVTILQYILPSWSIAEISQFYFHLRKVGPFHGLCRSLCCLRQGLALAYANESLESHILGLGYLFSGLRR